MPKKLLDYLGNLNEAVGKRFVVPGQYGRQSAAAAVCIYEIRSFRIGPVEEAVRWPQEPKPKENYIELQVETDAIDAEGFYSFTKLMNDLEVERSQKN